MWIESQDKRTILKSKGITIKSELDNASIPFYKVIDIETNTVLGVYADRNKIIKILDEVKAFIVSEYNYGHNIYSMPQSNI